MTTEQYNEMVFGLRFTVCNASGVESTLSYQFFIFLVEHAFSFPVGESICRTKCHSKKSQQCAEQPRREVIISKQLQE